MISPRRPWRTAALVVAVTGLVASACGAGDDTGQAAGPGSTPPTETVVATTAAATTTTDAGPRRLPIGDGKITTDGPRVGWVYTCEVPRGGGGAFRDGPWIDTVTGTWEPATKIAVTGNVVWDADYRVTVEGSNRIVESNGLPDHPTGVYPIGRDDPAYGYDRNPNSIRPSTLRWSLPTAPVVASAPGCVNMGAIGVMRSGVVLFNALDAMGRDAAAHETLDTCKGHPELDGSYHYHDLSQCVPGADAVDPTVVGWASDGYPIVAGRLDGRRVVNEDLDACHGREVAVDIDGTKVRTYAYWMTAEYPYSVGCFRGATRATVSVPRGTARAGAAPGRTS